MCEYHIKSIRRYERLVIVKHACDCMINLVLWLYVRDICDVEA